jgi:hypothetical protein
MFNGNLAYWWQWQIPPLEGVRMKKQWILIGVAIMGVSMTAFGAAAQGPGPQGAGAGEVGQSHAPRSYNPIKWVKKDPNTAAEKPKKAKHKKPSAKSATPDTRVASPGVWSRGKLSELGPEKLPRSEEYSLEFDFGHIPVTPFHRPYPFRVGDYFRIPRIPLPFGPLIQ